MQALEREAMEEEGGACQYFLWACGAALQACLSETLGVLTYPIQILTGNMSLIGLLTATLQQTISLRGPIPSPFCSERPATVVHPTGTK